MININTIIYKCSTILILINFLGVSGIEHATATPSESETEERIEVVTVISKLVDSEKRAISTSSYIVRLRNVISHHKKIESFISTFKRYVWVQAFLL